MEKSPKPYSKGKISNEQIFNKNFQNLNGKSLRINLQGKISMNKSSLKFFQKFNF